MNEEKTFGVVSLGCDKNRIDTENAIAYLLESGYKITNDPSKASVIVINTCGFIKSAIKEAIDTIFEMVDYKTSGVCKRIVVTGCLTQRYMMDIFNDIKEIDIVLGTQSYRKLPELLDQSFLNNERIFVENDINDRDFSSKRYLTTPPHYAYIKIAEGCNNHCTYCAIPKIRGKYTSRDIKDIVAEAKELIKNYPLKELIVVAQDVTYYGYDRDRQFHLIELLEELSKTDIQKIRILYCYPELVSEELIKYISTNKKMCKYIDIPLQHVNDRILKLMGRKVEKKQIVDLIKSIRRIDKDITIRSTFIVGFPSETEEEFMELIDFLKEYKLDRVGFFAYSKEENTPAAKLKEQIPSKIKNQRQKEAYKVQEKIMIEKEKLKVGSVVEVIYEGIDFDKSLFYGRSQSEAPDIDDVIYFKSTKPLNIGEYYKIKINKYDRMKLNGEVIDEED